MKNLILISTLLAAGTLAANAETTLGYTNVGNLFSGIWRDNNTFQLFSSSLNLYSGFYTFKTSEYDFNNLASVKFNIYLSSLGSGSSAGLKVWAVERENTDLNKTIAEEIIKSANKTESVSTSPTVFEAFSMFSIDITSVLKKITQGKDVAILIGMEWGDVCCLDFGKSDPTTLSVEFAAVPEPSAFGLLAGLGALALAGTRRRRK